MSCCFWREGRAVFAHGCLSAFAVSSLNGIRLPWRWLLAAMRSHSVAVPWEGTVLLSQQQSCEVCCASQGVSWLLAAAGKGWSCSACLLAGLSNVLSFPVFHVLPSHLFLWRQQWAALCLWKAQPVSALDAQRWTGAGLFKSNSIWAAAQTGGSGCRLAAVMMQNFSTDVCISVQFSHICSFPTNQFWAN